MYRPTHIPCLHMRQCTVKVNCVAIVNSCTSCAVQPRSEWSGEWFGECGRGDYKLVGLQTKDHSARERGLLLVHKSWGCVIQTRLHGRLKLHISTHTRTGATAGESNRPQVST